MAKVSSVLKDESWPLTSSLSGSQQIDIKEEILPNSKQFKSLLRQKQLYGMKKMWTELRLTSQLGYLQLGDLSNQLEY